MRCTEMQLWPANAKAFAASFAAVASTSASAATTTGVELPSSSFTRFRGARSCKPQPTSPEPVKVISFTRSSSTRTSPISEARPTITLSQPAGRPASASSSARSRAESGVCDAGFSTTGHPAASAGASLCATRLHGKLNGEIAPTIPIGRRTVNASLPSPACAASIGTSSPASFRASTAANVYVDIARDASTRAVLIGLPASSQIVRATSSCRRPINPATLTRISARLCAGSGSASAAAAASTARRASSAPLFGACPTTSPEYGERTSITSVATTRESLRRVIRAVLGAEVVAGGERIPCFAWTIDHPDGLVLVDTGMIDSTPELDAEWQPTPHPENLPRDVVCVINTHLHFDHCGGNRLYPGLPIHVQARELADARLLDDYTIPQW